VVGVISTTLHTVQPPSWIGPYSNGFFWGFSGPLPDKASTKRQVEMRTWRRKLILIRRLPRQLLSPPHSPDSSRLPARNRSLQSRLSPLLAPRGTEEEKEYRYVLLLPFPCLLSRSVTAFLLFFNLDAQRPSWIRNRCSILLTRIVTRNLQ
jgi:hypothetical protein